MVPNKYVRPTTDFVREAIYNIIGSDIEDASVLDLFGGSGALSIEAMSRYAKDAVIIDKNHMSIKFIKTNLSALGIEDGVKVIKGDATLVIKKLDENEAYHKKFHYVFIDPPYKEIKLYQKVLTLLRETDLLHEDVCLICELDSKEDLGEVEGYEELKNKKYGNSRIVFLALKK